MNAVVSLLDAEHTRRVEVVWAELRNRFGLRGIAVTPYPHFSYQIAPDYDLDRLAETLEEMARQHPPFTIRTGGLAVFTGPAPVLYVPVVRTTGLSALHLALWGEIGPLATGAPAYYEPQRWLPHITLAQGDLTPGRLAAVMTHLADEDFSWEVRIDNLAFIHDAGGGQVVGYRFPLGGRR